GPANRRCRSRKSEVPSHLASMSLVGFPSLRSFHQTSPAQYFGTTKLSACLCSPPLDPACHPDRNLLRQPPYSSVPRLRHCKQHLPLPLCLRTSGRRDSPKDNSALCHSRRTNRESHRRSRRSQPLPTSCPP